MKRHILFMQRGGKKEVYGNFSRLFFINNNSIIDKYLNDSLT